MSALMIALLMCGGKGTRLGMGEKPLVEVLGKKLIDHVLDHLVEFDVIAVTSHYTSKTEDYLKKQGINYYRARGLGFVQDYMEAVKRLRIFEPVLIVSSDIIIFKSKLIENVVSYYFKSKTKALQTVVKKTCKPIGINVIDGFFIDCKQSEVVYTINELDAININTRDDIKKAEKVWDLMSSKRKEKD